MDFGLTDEQELLLDSLRELLERECPESSIAELDRTHQAPTSFRRAAVLLREAKGREPCLVQRTPERRGCLVGPVELSDGGLGALALEELPKAVEQQLLLVRQAEVHGSASPRCPAADALPGPRRRGQRVGALKPILGLCTHVPGPIPRARIEQRPQTERNCSVRRAGDSSGFTPGLMATGSRSSTPRTAAFHTTGSRHAAEAGLPRAPLRDPEIIDLCDGGSSAPNVTRSA